MAKSDVYSKYISTNNSNAFSIMGIYDFAQTTEQISLIQQFCTMI